MKIVKINEFHTLEDMRASRCIDRNPDLAAGFLFGELQMIHNYMEGYSNRKSLKNSEFQCTDFDVGPDEFIERLYKQIGVIVNDLERIYDDPFGESKR